MSLTPQNLIKNPNPIFSQFPPNTTQIFNSLKTQKNSLTISPKDPTFSIKFLSFPTFLHKIPQTHHCFALSFDNEGDLIKKDENYINLDTLLPVIELACIACSVGITIGLSLKNDIFTRFGNRVFGFQLGFLLGAVAIGAAIRERQWRRVCGFSKRGSEKVNLVERIEKLEEDVKSSTTIVRVLSRQLEKLGVRFRVTRKTLKDPIAEASALAQKNSETTRALAAQEENLEKELSEIQKVLLLMQEQQQKQLELILAIAKTGKLRDTKQGPTQEQQKKAIEAHKLNQERPNQMIKPHTQALRRQKESNNDKA